MAAIGNVSEYRIQSTDTYGENYDTKVMGNLNPEATYQQIDAASRALIGLTKNTYDDTILITSISVNEVLAEE